jgi:hypothetical protein
VFTIKKLPPSSKRGHLLSLNTVLSSVVDPDPELEVMDPASDPELDLNLTKIHKENLAI